MSLWNIVLAFSQLIVVIGVAVLPGLLTIIFAKRMVDYNARSYPRIYTPFMKKFALVLFYLGGLGWMLFGIWGWILPMLEGK